MEEIDLNSVKLTDSEYFDKNSSYANFFRRKNIKTIGEIIDGTFHNCSFNGYRVNGDTALALKSFIEVLRHKYYDEPLVMEVYLDRSIDLEKTYKFGGYGRIKLIPIEGEEDATSMTKFVCGSRADYALIKFVERQLSVKNDQEIKRLDTKNVKIIDFFRWILAEGNEYDLLIPYAKMYIDVYEKNKNIVKEDESSIKYLKGQLESLIKTRSDLDIQIKELQEKIETLSKGGIVK